MNIKQEFENILKIIFDFAIDKIKVNESLISTSSEGKFYYFYYNLGDIHCNIEISLNLIKKINNEYFYKIVNINDFVLGFEIEFMDIKYNHSVFYNMYLKERDIEKILKDIVQNLKLFKKIDLVIHKDFIEYRKYKNENMTDSIYRISNLKSIIDYINICKFSVDDFVIDDKIIKKFPELII